MAKIEVRHVARIEGHAGIEVEIERKKVKKVKVNIPEGPRLFETLVLGKTPEEAVSIVPRICAICSVSHRLASITAFERAFELKVPLATKLLRELMHYGEIIESNSLHVFLLALPDYLGYPNAIAMTDKYADQVMRGLRLKKFGNRIMEITSARYTHGENPNLGGFYRWPSRTELTEIKKEAERLLPDGVETVELLRNLHYPTSMEEGLIFMCLNPPTETYGFTGDSVLISNGEEKPIDDYRKITNERVVAHSTAKRCRYNDKPYIVGPLARMNLLGERLHGKASEAFKRCYSLTWVRNPLYANQARAIEILFCLEEIPKLVDRLLEMPPAEIKEPTKKSGKAVGAVEAPRGTLYHYYEVARGYVRNADFVIPTTQNLDAMERHIQVACENLLETEKTKKEDIELLLEMVVRSYDPCVSCSAHLVNITYKK
uniref:Ni/Fe hydrogenase subunit alpha n=1 Tax=candidate division WOR-3 bacterium TaxID=2052148 RepID=A0A7C6AAW9_UNCW3